MKKAETIIIQIDRLERELYTNYDLTTIKKAIEKCINKHKVKTNGCDLIWTIYTGIDEVDINDNNRT